MALKKGFTLVELLIVVTIMVFILFFVYRIFFSQTKAVTQSIEFLQVNDNFRKIIAIMGNDIREASNIIQPVPIMIDEVESLKTKPGVILHLQSSALDPAIKFDSPLGGQVSSRQDIVYELEKLEGSSPVPRYRLVRKASVEEKPGQKITQRQIIADTLCEMVIYRTIKRPFKASNVGNKDDHIVLPISLRESGTGNNLVHINMSLERLRNESETGSVYNISMNTSFYKRGKEIFKNP